jgi:hypothetical protein
VSFDGPPTVGMPVYIAAMPHSLGSRIGCHCAIRFLLFPKEPVPTSPMAPPRRGLDHLLGAAPAARRTPLAVSPRDKKAPRGRGSHLVPGVSTTYFDEALGVHAINHFSTLSTASPVPSLRRTLVWRVIAAPARGRRAPS